MQTTEFRIHRSTNPRHPALPKCVLKALSTRGLVSATLISATLLFQAEFISFAQCGGSGNTLWTFTEASSQTEAAINSTNIYLSGSPRLSRIRESTGAEADFVTYTGVTLGRPVVFDLRNRFRDVSDIMVVAGDNGYLYQLDPLTLLQSWNISLKRTGYADSITAAPVVQQWNASDPDFQAIVTNGVIMVGTHYDSATANRVYGLDAGTGSVLWIFNSTGSFQMNVVNGLELDYAQNTVYAVTSRSNGVSQNTVFALSTTNHGVKRWGRDLGDIQAEPVLGREGLYVVTSSGTLYKLDPASGATIWQQVVTTSNQVTRLTADAANGHIFVLDSSGTLHAFLDQCASASEVWTFKKPGAMVTAAAAFHNIGGRFVYAASDDGRVWQVRASDGVAQAYATVSISGSAVSFDPIVYQDPAFPGHYRLLARSGIFVKKLCIPWPDTPGEKS